MIKDKSHGTATSLMCGVSLQRHCSTYGERSSKVADHVDKVIGKTAGVVFDLQCIGIDVATAAYVVFLCMFIVHNRRQVHRAND